ncbi:MAG: S41 family peptidase [Janthinobacterium lividum]
MQLSRDFRSDQTLQATFVRLSAFTAQIQCGHTYPSFFNQSKAVTTALFERPDRLPFFYRWVERKMIVTKDFTPDHRLPVGTEVLSIDGIASGEILNRLLPLIRADGANEAKRIDLLQVQGTSPYEAADIFLPMIFPRWSTPFALRIRKTDGKRGEHVIAAPVSFAERKVEGLGARVDPHSGAPLFTLRYLHSGAALLTMPTWVMYQGNWDWQAWLNESLDDIVARKSPALIVDLRGNEGGDDVGTGILARLKAASDAAEPYARLVRYRKAPAELLPYLQTWDASFKDWGETAVALEQPWPTAPPVPYFRQVDTPSPAATTPPAPQLKPYTGKVYVLTDASNSSATYGFERTIQTEHLGTLVGQPSGGNKRGTNGGAFFFLRLPRSGIEIDLPLIGYFPVTVEPNEGLQPDVFLLQSVIGNTGTDAELTAVELAIHKHSVR